MVELILNELNTEITSTKALLDGKQVLLDGIDACAVYDGISVNLMKSIFLFQTDSEYEQTKKIKYYTFTNPEFNIKLSESTLDHIQANRAIVNLRNNTMFLSNDFIRYLAQCLFGTHQGVDLFVNEEDLNNDLKNKLDNSMDQNYNLMQSINAIDGTDASLNTDTVKKYVYDHRIGRYVNCYTKYFMDNYDNNKNLCRELMLQMLYYNPERFANLEDTKDTQPLPFISGDTLNFKISVYPSQGQELLTGLQSPINKRTYQIKIIIKEPLYLEIPLPQKTASLNYTGLTTLYPTITFINFQNLNYFDYVLLKVTLYIQTNNSNVNTDPNVYIDDAYNYYLTTFLKVYPKGFYGNATFPFNNLINGDSNYQIDANDPVCPNGRMFYIINMNNINYSSDFITININTSNEFIFVINPAITNNIEKIINFQVEIQNNGILPLQYISSKNFDINFI